MTNLNHALSKEKTVAIKAFIDALTPVAFDMLNSANENAKKELDKTLKRIENILVKVLMANDYSDYQLISEKKEAMLACVDTVNKIKCKNKDEKNALDEALNGIVKMLDSEFEIHARKKAAIIVCIDALALVNMMDCTNEDEKNALQESLKSIATYPNITGLKRNVLKPYTPDHYAVIAQTHLLGISLSGECSQVSINLINEALGNALELLQSR